MDNANDEPTAEEQERDLRELGLWDNPVTDEQIEEMALEGVRIGVYDERIKEMLLEGGHDLTKELAMVEVRMRLYDLLKDNMTPEKILGDIKATMYKEAQSAITATQEVYQAFLTRDTSFALLHHSSPDIDDAYKAHQAEQDATRNQQPEMDIEQER